MSLIDAAHRFIFRGDIERFERVRCPFHEEQTPSCYIIPSSQTFYCFGCGMTGTVEELDAQRRQQAVEP